jgi:CHAD domain-containing protein
MRKLIRSQTAARLKKLDREVRQVARKPADADAIHDLRVSIRRLRQELRIFSAWLDADDVKSIHRRLRKLMDRCAAVRNCDVGIEVLRDAGCQDPQLIAGLEKERQQTREHLAETLERWRNRDRVGKWRGRLRVARPASKNGVISGESALEIAKGLLPPMIEDLFPAGRAAARAGSDHRAMHQFRLKTKRVRYTLEIFEPVYGPKTARIMKLLKGLQEKLGAINDCATTLEMIRRDREAATAVRLLAGQREAEFRTYWKKNFGAREKAQWKAVLSAADRKN